jgi:putative ABC transport system permease protein
MRNLAQILAVSSISLRSLPQRLASSLVVVIGIGGVVAVLLSVLALSTGLASTLAATGRDDRAIVLHAQSTAETGSSLARENVDTILNAPGMARATDGKPLASAEALATVNVPERKGGQLSSLALRGVGAKGLDLRPELHIVEGRVFRAGLRELIAGRSAQGQFSNLGVGDNIKFGDTQWTVVGIFESGGGAHDSELLADADTVLSAYQRITYNSVTVKLDGHDGFEKLQAALTQDPTLQVTVNRETDYYEQQSRGFSLILKFIATVVSSIMAVGAVFAALNTMYSAVASRGTEIATLRAIGFGPSGVLVSVMVEALLLSLLGAVFGAGIAWAVFDGNTVGMLSGGSMAQVVFHLHIGPALMVTGVIWACAVGLLGGLLPGIRAARMPVAMAIRG